MNTRLFTFVILTAVSSVNGMGENLKDVPFDEAFPGVNKTAVEACGGDIGCVLEYLELNPTPDTPNPTPRPTHPPSKEPTEAPGLDDFDPSLPQDAGLPPPWEEVFEEAGIPDLPDEAPPNTSDAGAIPPLPEAPRIPGPPGRQGAPGPPEVPELPDSQGMPDIPDGLDVPELPEIPDVPEVPETPQISDAGAPDIPDGPELPDIPDGPEIPEISDAGDLGLGDVPEFPGAPQSPDTPELPDAGGAETSDAGGLGLGDVPEFPGAPQSPDTPELPDAGGAETSDAGGLGLGDVPEFPGAPQSPDTPELPDAGGAETSDAGGLGLGDVPEFPDAPESPNTPELPDAGGAETSDAGGLGLGDVPEFPDAPESPNTPELPDAGGVPDVPESPLTSDAAGAPVLPDVPDSSELPDIGPSNTPQISDAGGQGDPHFKTWRNEHFEYHGQCDLILAMDSNFADGLGLDVQIRTKVIRYWSYIKSVAIRIGADILEIEGNGDISYQDLRYWINMELRGPVETVGGFPVIFKVPKEKAMMKQTVLIDLSSKYPGAKIEIQVWKEFVKINFQNPTDEAFGNTVGMLGDFNNGKTLGRDGVTVLDDYMLLGEEWQVLPADNMLFHSTEEPQFPSKCIEPEDPQGERRRRRLGEMVVTEEQAEKACAGAPDKIDRKDCVYDILATQRLDMAAAYLEIRS
eukprot:CAMPEP_0113640390 /NCGR_PEP_ID=MMETSP0017_2-20120614/21199_1 /TAXON_ID=2856 /ORGANISM="Cylindrotheca closterium" /LENGTH=687 /DNA_ID=CAMNT_0000551671 /DNA_START=68 /DNA_END=2134 /DNA_ORIENTATION=+ /assembly_acc=CAM_ASM_000147